MPMVIPVEAQETHMHGTVHQNGFATAIEAAQFLRVSKSMIFKLIGEGKMPSCRYGRAVRIPWHWLRTQAGE